MTRRPEVFLGIDLGSTQLKAGFVTPSGELLGQARARYPLESDPVTGRAEQDPERWWSGLAGALAEIRGAATGSAPEVVGMAVAGHGPTLAAVDVEGRPTRPAVTWLDTRTAVEAEILAAATGLRGWALGVLPAALWLERHDPGSVADARWYLNTWDALTLRLTGRAVTSLLPGQPVPSPAQIATAGLSGDRIPARVDAGSIVGALTPAAAAVLGLQPGVPVAAGLVDAFASFHGAGMVRAGDAIDVGGAAGGFGVYATRPIQAAGSFTSPAPLPGLWSVGGAMAATGTALDWLRDAVLGGGRSTEALIQEAAGVAAGADGLLFLPYLAGERSPLWDPGATGAFVGLSLQHGRAHLTRAVLEAAALSMRHVAEPILAAGAVVSAMRACGGPAHSRTWNAIKADVTGFPVEVPRIMETALVGAAIVAAVGVGVHPDLPTAIGAMTAIGERMEPDAAMHARYDDVYAAYVALYPAIAGALASRAVPEPNGRAA
jgi:xylulokinase